MSSEHESVEDKVESEYEHEQAFAALEGIVTAQVDGDCDGCGLNIHVGDPIVLGPHSWLHPVCGVQYAADVAVERRYEADDVRRDF